MKELTEKEKARRYDEAIKKLHEIITMDNTPTTPREIGEYLFSELKESEDERIRKWLIELVEEVRKANPTNAEHNGMCSEAVAWLEKQGEQKPVVIIPKFRVGDEIKTTNEAPLTITKITDSGYWSEDLFICSFENSAKWELVEKLVDKVKPKFKVGDWVIFDNGNVERITSVGTHGYTFDDGDYLLHDDCDKNAHLWTIQDAKDGDVLAVEPIEGYYLPFIAIYKERGFDFFNSHCFIGFDGIFYNGDIGHSIDNIHPATKEQRDALMKAMADAGYTFDSEKKELKKNRK